MSFACALETITSNCIEKGNNCVSACISLCPISWVHYSIRCCIHIYKKRFLHFPALCSPFKCNKLYFNPCNFMSSCSDMSEECIIFIMVLNSSFMLFLSLIIPLCCFVQYSINCSLYKEFYRLDPYATNTM